MSKNKKSILIIDDKTLFREGLKEIIKKTNKYNVVDEAKSAEEGLEKTIKLKPAIALVSINIPKINGFKLAEWINEKLKSTKVAIISVYKQVEYAIKSFQAGAFGYITMYSSKKKFIECCDNILKDEYFIDDYISKEVTKKILEDIRKGNINNHFQFSGLTKRELEIFKVNCRR